MSFDDAAVRTLFDDLESHLLSLGIFDSVNTHEPKSGPVGNGITAAMWMQRVRPVRTSGLASTSAVIVFMARLYTNMLTSPEDMIDPNLLAAATTVIDAYSGDFTLDGTVREVDLLGAYGTPLGADAAYVKVDKHMYRVYDITIPVVINDCWVQTP